MAQARAAATAVPEGVRAQLSGNFSKLGVGLEAFAAPPAAEPALGGGVMGLMNSLGVGPSPAPSVRRVAVPQPSPKSAAGGASPSGLSA